MTNVNSIASFSSLGYMGELGNQMFQVAAVTNYAKKTGKIAKFPIWKCGFSRRDYSNIFKNPIDQSLLIDPSNTIREYYMDLKYVSMPILNGNVDFAGYFQSEKYFSEINVKSLFEPNEEITKYIETKFKDIIDYPTKVALHVRTAKRKANDSDVHASATKEFIEKAMEDFTDKDLFVVFADNLEEAKKILPVGRSYHIIENEENYIDLFLMNYFDSYIISPSTFGWWGAHLSKAENPRITIMKDWFAKDKSKAYLNDNDIIPDSWKKI